MKIKGLFFILITVVAMVSLCTCQTNEPYKIGYSGTLSGMNSELGVSGRNGAELAVTFINEKGGIKGKKLEIIVKDDKNDKKTAKKVDQELSAEGVSAIIGHMTSGMADFSVPYVNENQMFMLSPTIATDVLSNQDDYFFRMIPSNVEQASLVAKSMKEENIRKVAILFDASNLTFTEGLKNSFKQYYLENGGVIVFEEPFYPTAISYEAVSKKIVRSGAEGLFVIGAADNSVLICQQFYKNQMDIKTFLPSWAMTGDLINHGGRAIEGAILVNFYNNEAKNEDYNAFKLAYKTLYSDDPSFSAQFSYEAVMVVAEALNDLDLVNGETIKQYVLARKNFKGLQGDLYFNDFGDMNRQQYLYKVNNGMFELIEDGGYE